MLLPSLLLRLRHPLASLLFPTPVPYRLTCTPSTKFNLVHYCLCQHPGPQLSARLHLRVTAHAHDNAASRFRICPPQESLLPPHTPRLALLTSAHNPLNGSELSLPWLLRRLGVIMALLELPRSQIPYGPCGERPDLRTLSSQPRKSPHPGLGQSYPPTRPETLQPGVPAPRICERCTAAGRSPRHHSSTPTSPS